MLEIGCIVRAFSCGKKVTTDVFLLLNMLNTLTLIVMFSTLSSLYSLGTDKENLFDNLELLKVVIISFILITFLFDLRVILSGETRSQLLCSLKEKINRHFISNLVAGLCVFRFYLQWYNKINKSNYCLAVVWLHRSLVWSQTEYVST